MAGITLTGEEIRLAPPEVRRWLELEIARALGQPPSPLQPPAPTLVGCNVEEARGMLGLVQNMLPVVSVLFELGRESGSVAVHGMRAFRIVDILRHARLASPDQVIECLDLLTDALRRVRNDVTAALYAVDDQGHCLVAEATMRSILRLWQEIVAERALQGQPVAGEQPVVAAG